VVDLPVALGQPHVVDVPGRAGDVIAVADHAASVGSLRQTPQSPPGPHARQRPPDTPVLNLHVLHKRLGPVGHAEKKGANPFQASGDE
jgi:hypothetical protein